MKLFSCNMNRKEDNGLDYYDSTIFVMAEDREEAISKIKIAYKEYVEEFVLMENWNLFSLSSRYNTGELLVQYVFDNDSEQPWGVIKPENLYK